MTRGKVDIFILRRINAMVCNSSVRQIRVSKPEFVIDPPPIVSDVLCLCDWDNWKIDEDSPSRIATHPRTYCVASPVQVRAGFCSFSLTKCTLPSSLLTIQLHNSSSLIPWRISAEHRYREIVYLDSLCYYESGYGIPRNSCSIDSVRFHSASFPFPFRDGWVLLLSLVGP